MLTEHPASVILPNYRTDWLSDSDKAFINANYLSLSDDLLVLGGAVTKGDGDWTCLHGGRYFLGTDGGKSQDLLLDGKGVTANPLWIEPGTHHLHGSEGRSIYVVWVGPVLEAPPRIVNTPHLSTFVNWY